MAEAGYVYDGCGIDMDEQVFDVFFYPPNPNPEQTQRAKMQRLITPVHSTVNNEEEETQELITAIDPPQEISIQGFSTLEDEEEPTPLVELIGEYD